MREVGLTEANLSDLIAEVTATGEEVVIMRQGAPAARLTPVVAAPSVAERAAIIASLIASRDSWAAANPTASAARPWDEIKALIDDR